MSRKRKTTTEAPTTETTTAESSVELEQLRSELAEAKAECAWLREAPATNDVEISKVRRSAAERMRERAAQAVECKHRELCTAPGCVHRELANVVRALVVD